MLRAGHTEEGAMIGMYMYNSLVHMHLKLHLDRPLYSLSRSLSRVGRPNNMQPTPADVK